MDPFTLGSAPPRPPSPPHYYGDTVRALFLLAGVVVLLASPLDEDIIPYGWSAAIPIALIVVLLAGMTSPRQRFVMAANAAVSAAGLAFFEYAAFATYRGGGELLGIVFVSQQLLALIFFFALYYASKTLRGRVTARTPLQ